MNEIAVASFPITLGQLLKLANFVQDGIEAKLMITEGRVSVNGTVCTQRGKKLYQDTLIEVESLGCCKIVSLS